MQRPKKLENRGPFEGNPYIKLWAAVVENALEDIQRKTWKGPMGQYQEIWRDNALNWFKSNETHLGSFLSLCPILNLDPQAVRKAIIEHD